MRMVVYELNCERTFRDVADTSNVCTLYDEKEDAIRALKQKIEEWTKSKTFSTEDTFKVDKSDDTDNPAFYIEDGTGNSISAKILEHRMNLN